VLSEFIFKKEILMASCHDMKLGQVYVCEQCGLELKVVKECEECGKDATECECVEHCDFACCGKPLKLKGD
jgi:hypothetical protein